MATGGSGLGSRRPGTTAPNPDQPTSEKDLRASVLGSSEEVFDYYCQPCQTENVHREATGYCKQCKEYICGNCCRDHMKNAASRHHKILGNGAMPKTTIVPRVADILTEACSTHSDKVLKFFCRDHNRLACSVCVALTHSTCKKSYIPDISGGVADSTEYTNLVTELTKFITLASRTQLQLDQDQQNNDTYRSEAAANIKACRKGVDQLLDKVETEALRSLDEQHVTTKVKLEDNSKRCQVLRDEVTALAAVLQEKATNRKSNQLFVDLQLAPSRLANLQQEMGTITDRQPVRYTFDEEAMLTAIKSSLPAMWSVMQRGPEVKASHLRDVTFRADDDTEDCSISGIAVMPGDCLVVTDYNNKAVKLVDVSSNKIISRLTLTSEPLNVTRTKDGEVAVILPGEYKIEILTVAGTITRSHTINLPGIRAVSLCYSGDTFIVLDQLARSVIRVDLNGRVVDTLYTDSDDEPIFKAPRCITLGRGQNVLYITDNEANSVTTMTLTGDVVTVYKHDALQYPVGVTTDRYCNVYACSYNTHTVHQLSDTGQQVGVVLDEGRGLAPGPFAIAYSGENKGTLYISSGSEDPQYCNLVKAFQLE